ncbi:hypothetical protein AGMMS49944_22070 [Spirochaetia bacterium]|nr:hypothetical protein AGMMS49944_22070 [Spirochaetia bacterium]
MVWADDADFPDWDMDTLFDEPADGGEEKSLGESTARGNVPSALVRPMGFSIDASYYFHGGIAPGWNPAPWHGDSAANDDTFSNVIGLGMATGIGLDFRISDVLRVKNIINFSYPGFILSVDEFFFDYSIKNAVFIRAGKYGHNWGISPNFPFSNLLARVPDGSVGDAIMLKADIPIGIGGIQVLALTRSKDAEPTLKEVGYGAKYNLAFPWIDIDMGAFYLEAMPLRGFLSLKKTFWETEVYAEGMTSVQHPAGDEDTWGNWEFSANLGLVQNFFAAKLTVNAEVFYNGEGETLWFRPKTVLQEADTPPFIGGWNTALNLRFKPGWFKDLRFGLQFLYAFQENTAQLVPALTFNPLPHMAMSLAVPMALGSKEGTYYSHNADTKNRPFSIVLVVSISGGRSFGF